MPPWLILSLSVAAVGVFCLEWRSVLMKRCDVLAAHLEGMERDWVAISRETKDAEAARNKYRALISRPKRLEEIRTAPRWAWILGIVAESCGEAIELQDLHARQMTGVARACELQADGVAFGLGARANADRFRQRIEQELQEGLRGVPVKVGFLRLEDESDPSAALSTEQRIAFEVVATVGMKDPAVFKPSTYH